MPKRALITSGGGAKGAFTVGALTQLADLGVTSYDIISGTSTGALIAALTTIGDLKTLRDVYLDVGNDDILKKQNLLENFTRHKPFLYSTEPLKVMIEKHITQEVFEKIMASPTILCLSSVSLQTGKIWVFCTKPIPKSNHYIVSQITTHERLKEALLASGSQAGFLPLVDIQTRPGDAGSVEQFADGGHRDVIPSRVVIDLKPEEIFVLSNNPEDLFKGEKDYKKQDIIKIIERTIAIFIQDVRENDIALLNSYSKESGAKVFRIEPTRDLDPKHPTGLNFNTGQMIGWLADGRAKAAAVFQSGNA